MASKRTKSVKSNSANHHVLQAEDSSTNEGASSQPNSNPDMFCGVHRSILEAFDNLNWHDNMSPERYESFTRHWIPPEEKSVSHAMKLINSELARFVTKEIKLPPLPKDEENIVFYLPGLKPNHQTILPKVSVLTKKEQKQLYTFYCRMTFKNSRPLNEQELAKFQVLRTKVAEEYAEFQEFAKSEWYKGQWKRVLQIPPQVEQFIDSLWKMRAGQCLTGYPDEYKSVKQIPLALHDPNQDFSLFEFVKHVHTQSLPPKMNLLKIREPFKLICEFEDLSRIKPVSGDFQNRPKSLTKSISAVSFDHNVERLLKRDDLDIDVVISMSGIKTLVDNIKFQREWILPVTVKDVLRDDGETIKRVVIIDKNLPPKSMSVHEKNLWHAKVVAKWMLVLSSCPSLLDKKESPRFKGKRDSESYEDMLSEVVEKLNMERSTGNVEMKSESLFQSPQSSGQQNKSEPSVVGHEQGASCNKPKARSSLENNLEARAKGDRLLTSNDDLPSDANQSNLDGSSVNVDVKPKQHFKKQESLVNREQIKNEPSLVSRGHWGSFNNPKTLLQEKNVKSRKRERQSLISYDDPFSDFVVQDLEEFGVDPAPPRNVHTQDIKPKNSASSNSAVEDSPVKKIKSPEEEVSTGSVTTSVAGEIPTTSFGRIFLKPAATRRGMQTPCLQYQIWNLHKSRYIQFLKLEQRSLNVLVRTRKDGKLFHYQNNTKIQDDACVSSKLEFQPEYGASKMAASELTREYLDLYMRPNSKLVRVRSIGHTKEVMMSEVKSISEIKTALQVEVRQIQRLFDPLYAVLTKLIDLPPGRYMLQHTAKMGPFATLLVESPGWTNFNLPQYCQELTRVEVNVPPMPIDPLVLSPLQHREKVAPALFVPRCSSSEKVSHNRYFSKPKSSNYIKKERPRNKKKHQKKNTPANDESLNVRDLSDSVDSLGIDNLWKSQLH